MATRRTTKSARVETSRGVYMISVAAELAEMHPQTLRMYEQRGLIEPKRSPKGTRLYSHEDVERLRRIQAMTNELGLDGALDLLQAGDLLLQCGRARLERLHLAPHPGELLLELEHALDPREVHAPVRGHLLDAAQALHVVLGVEARALRGALGLDQPTRLVHAQRLRVHLGQLGRDGDHEHAAAGGHLGGHTGAPRRH
jgi:DNA-binding transcriptional MerR regulator